MESLLASHNVMKLLSHGSSDADKLLDELITTLFNSQTTIDFTVRAGGGRSGVSGCAAA